jgi:hypothetical protein
MMISQLVRFAKKAKPRVEGAQQYVKSLRNSLTGIKVIASSTRKKTWSNFRRTEGFPVSVLQGGQAKHPISS